MGPLVAQRVVALLRKLIKTLLEESSEDLNNSCILELYFEVCRSCCGVRAKWLLKVKPRCSVCFCRLPGFSSVSFLLLELYSEICLLFGARMISAVWYFRNCAKWTKDRNVRRLGCTCLSGIHHPVC